MRISSTRSNKTSWTTIKFRNWYLNWSARRTPLTLITRPNSGRQRRPNHSGNQSSNWTGQTLVVRTLGPVINCSAKTNWLKTPTIWTSKSVGTVWTLQSSKTLLTSLSVLFTRKMRESGIASPNCHRTDSMTPSPSSFFTPAWPPRSLMYVIHSLFNRICTKLETKTWVNLLKRTHSTFWRANNRIVVPRARRQSPRRMAKWWLDSLKTRETAPRWARVQLAPKFKSTTLIPNAGGNARKMTRPWMTRGVTVQ